MQPLKILNNVEKAKLLHNLFSYEISDFLIFLKELTENILTNEEETKANWQDQLFGAEFWFELAKEVQTKTIKHPKDLNKNANVFAVQLFDGYAAIFTIHALTQYTAPDKQTNPKFKQAVDLLFT